MVVVDTGAAPPFEAMHGGRSPASPHFGGPAGSLYVLVLRTSPATMPSMPKRHCKTSDACLISAIKQANHQIDMRSPRLEVPALLATVHSTGSCTQNNVAAFAPPQPTLHSIRPTRRRRTPVHVDNVTGAPGRNAIHHRTFHSSLHKNTLLSFARYDNLVSGLAEISIGFSLGVLWSEFAVVTSGCGPLNFSDTLERICYQGVILTAGLSLFTKIVTIGDQDLTSYVCDEYFGGSLAEATVVQVRAAELLSILAVVGAFVSLGFQIAHGEQMDGLSGINTELCRAVRDL